MPKHDFYTGICNAYQCGDGFINEFAEENPFSDSYNIKGVMADTEGDGLRLSYFGLLPKSGAQDVYVVVNYGDNRSWDNVRTYPMDRIGYKAFEVVLPINENININVAFKDGANNWDNNSGKNYSFNMH